MVWFFFIPLIVALGVLMYPCVISWVRQHTHNKQIQYLQPLRGYIYTLNNLIPLRDTCICKLHTSILTALHDIERFLSAREPDGFMLQDLYDFILPSIQKLFRAATVYQDMRSGEANMPQVKANLQLANNFLQRKLQAMLDNDNIDLTSDNAVLEWAITSSAAIHTN